MFVEKKASKEADREFKVAVKQIDIAGNTEDSKGGEHLAVTGLLG